MMSKMMIVATAFVVASVSAHDSTEPFVGTDTNYNLILNASVGRVLVNGKPIADYWAMVAELSQQVKVFEHEWYQHTDPNYTSTLGVQYQGTATWSQSCALTDDQQDAAMNAACQAQFGPEASAATYVQLVEGLIDGLPDNNPTNMWLTFAFPDPQECEDHVRNDECEHARNCVDPGDPIPGQCGIELGWETNCYSATRAVPCVFPY
eukprot:m.130598 g.130598  ORF g.130598 m.130598 type:complete len:207 (-) comp29487_c0_seq3:196-816(-)